MPQFLGYVDISGSVWTVPTKSPVQSTTYLTGKNGVVTGSLNFIRERQRDLYDSYINGEALRSTVGQAPDKTLTGSWGSIPSPSNYATQKATAPSWTQTQSGYRHGFVSTAFSSSFHEKSVLNAFLSGTIGVESAPVPASASIYYSKGTRLKRKTFSYIAGVGLENTDQYPFDGQLPFRAGTFVATSGTFFCRTVYNPASVTFDVPDFGKLRDIRVWVEFIHDVRGGTGSLGSYSAYPEQGLQNVQIALRSPNTNFRCAHPMLNAPELVNYQLRPGLSVSGFTSTTMEAYRGIPELLSNSYLLWAGHSIDKSLGIVLNSSTSSQYIEWNSDIDMRTIFHDGAQYSNPRDLTALFPTATDQNPGQGYPLSSSLNPALMSAPNSFAISSARNAGAPYTSLTESIRGQNFPWYIDPRIGLGELQGRSVTWSSGMIVPPGWLSAYPTATPFEFQTATSTNLGPPEIRAVYPLLDDVYVEHIYRESVDTSVTTNLYPTSRDFRKRIVGFRPGLRGTEINGRWTLMFGVGETQGSGSDPYPLIGHRRAGIWFRQARLELVYDEGQESSTFVPSTARSTRKSALVKTRPGMFRTQIMSGSSLLDPGIVYVYKQSPEEWGRYVGITDSTGSSPDYAVFTRITGSLADRLTISASLSVSGTAHTLYSYLNNQFRTPYIPLSSGTGEPVSFDQELSSAIARSVLDGSRVEEQRGGISSMISRTIGTTRKSDMIHSMLSGTV